MESRKLTDVLSNVSGQDVKSAWNDSRAADDFGTPLPKGEYIARVACGELFTSRMNGTPGYKIAFEIIEGEYTGRRLWHDFWLTRAAMPMTKRDLGKIGITSIEQLEVPIAESICCKLRVAQHTGDSGTIFNRIKSFDVVSIDPPNAEPFSPVDDPKNDCTGERTTFDFGTNAESVPSRRRQDDPA